MIAPFPELDRRQASEHYREAVRLDPDFQVARHNLRMTMALQHAAVNSQ